MDGLALWRTLNCQSVLPTVAEDPSIGLAVAEDPSIGLAVAEDPSIGLAVAEDPSIESQKCRVHRQFGLRDEKSQ